MSAALTNHMLTQIAFKRLSGKAMTSGLLSLPGETLGSTVQSSATTIFGQVVPNAPVSSSAQLFQIQSASAGQPGTVQQVEFDLVRVVGTKYQNSNGVEIEALEQDDGGTQAANTIAPRQGFGAALGVAGSVNTFHAYTIKLPAAYVASCSAADFTTYASTTKVPGADAPFTNGFMSTGSVQMQVVPEYLSTVTGTTNAYIPEIIATNGSVMNSTDDIDYYFDAMAGVLFVQDPSVLNNANPENPSSDASQPGKIRGFLYVGQYQSEVVSGDTVSLHFSASEGTGFTFANNATASFTSDSGGGLTVTAGPDPNNIEFALVDVISGSEQVQDSLSGVSLFRISSSTGTDDIDLQFGQTASFESGSAGITVKATGNTFKTVEIGAASDSVTFKDLTITETASINYLKVTFETASQLFSSGSTIFGNTMDDFHNFTGSVHFSSSQFSWDEPVGNASQAPLVYDASTGLIHTGSNYALSASGITQFQISGSNFIGGSTTQNGNFVVTDSNTITFAVSGGLEVTASAGDSITINATGLSASIATDIANATSSISTLTNASASFATDIINATASILVNETDITNATASILVNETDITNATASIADLVASASEGFLLRGGTGAGTPTNGGNVLPFGTASFVGTQGINIAPAGAGSTQLNISFGGDAIPSPLFISASGTGPATGSTSLAYGASASFAANGGGLEVTESAGQITYTLNPSTVSASAIFVSNNESGGDRAIIFAGDVADTNRFTTLESDESIFRYNPGLNGGTFTYNATNAVTMDGGQMTPTATTFNFATNANTDTLNIGNADGGQTVNILGSASIEGDLTVKGTTTSIRTTNLEVEDQFILLVSRSTAENLDGGIIIQTGKDSATAVGTALFYDDSESRWGLTKADDTAFNATSATPRQYVVSVSSSNSEPPTVPTDFGGSAASRYGMMYVDTNNTAGDGNTIWIYAE